MFDGLHNHSSVSSMSQGNSPSKLVIAIDFLKIRYDRIRFVAHCIDRRSLSTVHEASVEHHVQISGNDVGDVCSGYKHLCRISALRCCTENVPLKTY